ncbi:MAG: NACHT domain-containing protein [Myxococcales bacterium]|nr:NACHT domain-containing protein [Myxococcales bacterium]
MTDKTWATPASVPHNVVSPRTRFVGRDAELSILDDALVESRLVTVVGAPGVGKTRIAKELALARAADRAPRFHGGVWWCDLSGASDAEDALALITAAIPEPTRASAATSGGPTLLLVLDNFETVVGDAERVVSEWLERAPSSRLLVTSRERLRVAGERVVELSPLALPEETSDPSASPAYALFVDRAHLVSGSATFDEKQRQAIALVVRALDGLPLAIEIAAARTRLFAPTQILRSLSREGELLGPGASVVSRGTRTLEETFASSWEGLTPEERVALAHCTVFSGGFDWEAARAVIRVDGDGTPSTLDLLQSLRDRSLVATLELPSGELRMSLLTTVRAFAASKLDASVRVELERAHARHFLALIGVSPEADAKRGRATIALERENLTVLVSRAVADCRPADALRAAIALAALGSSLSYSWSLRLLEEALAVAEGRAPPRLLGWAREARGSLLRFLGQTRPSLEELERALELARREGDRALEARALTGLGNGKAVLAEWRAAREHLEAARELHRDVGDRLSEGRVQTMMAAASYNQDNLEEAASELDAALALQRAERDRPFEAMSVTSAGIVALARGEHTLARALLDEAVALHHDLGDRHWEAVTRGYRGALELDLGELEAARGALEPAVATLGQLGVHRAEAIALGHLGHTAALQGALDEAAAHYRAALGWHRLTSPDYEGLILVAQGCVFALRSDIASALAAFERAEEALRAFHRPSFVGAIHLGRALADVSLAEQAFAAGDAQRTAELEGRVARAVASAERAGAARSVDSRALARLLLHARARLAESKASAARRQSPASLVVHPDGRWFRAPNAGSVVDLTKRPSLQRMLRALVERRSAGPGELTVADLLECGWPGEKVLPEAGQERVYTAVSTLRRMGLKSVIVRRERGYALDPEVDVVASLLEP